MSDTVLKMNTPPNPEPKPANTEVVSQDDGKLTVVVNPEEKAPKPKEEKPKETPAKKEDPPAKTKEQSVEDMAKAAGFDMDKLGAEYAQNGDLTEETYKSLEAKGFTKEQVGKYIAGRIEEAGKYKADISKDIGGPKVFDEVLEFAKSTFSDEEKELWDAAMANPKAAKGMLKLAHARFVEQNGQEPSHVSGTSARTGTVKPFGSQAELVEAMNSKRYKNNDEAFHAEVRARLKVSNL